MYVGVDIGGTKTLVATLDDNGVVTEQTKFATPLDYGEFIRELAKSVDNITTKDWRAGAVAIPGKVDRADGIGVVFGNLPWQNVPIQRDAAAIFHCPISIENDANLAGLSEAMLHQEAETVLYVTISTGIGTGVIQHRQITEPDNHPEGGRLLLPHDGKLVAWESFASGHAIVEQFGKRAEDITDPTTWQLIARNLSLGILELLTMTQPDLVIIGGGVGTYFDRFATFLNAELKRYEVPLVPIPPIIQAARPELAVIYGCYDYAKYQLEAAA